MADLVPAKGSPSHQPPLVVISRPDLWPPRHVRGSFGPSMRNMAFKMAQTLPGSVASSAQELIESTLPASFFTDPPPYCLATFSTKRGDLPFRTMAHILPDRSIHLWDKDEIQAACNSLRVLYWDLMKNMERPMGWGDLYKWFDAHDLYYLGAQNLWNVANHLFDENKLIHIDVQREFALHIGRWADEWCANMANQAKLKAWNDRKGPLFTLLTREDHNQMGPINDDMIPMISDALKHRRHLVLQGPKAAGMSKPNHLLQACQDSTIHNWMAGQKILSANGLPPPPPASYLGSAMPQDPHLSSTVQSEVGKGTPQPQQPSVRGQKAVESLRASLYPVFAPTTAVVPDASPVCPGNPRRTHSAPACMIDDGREIEPAPKRFTVSVHSDSSTITAVNTPSSRTLSPGIVETAVVHIESPPATFKKPMKAKKAQAKPAAAQVIKVPETGAIQPSNPSIPFKQTAFKSYVPKKPTSSNSSTGNGKSLVKSNMTGFHGPSIIPQAPFMTQRMVQQQG